MARRHLGVGGRSCSGARLAAVQAAPLHVGAARKGERQQPSVGVPSAAAGLGCVPGPQAGAGDTAVETVEEVDTEQLDEAVRSEKVREGQRRSEKVREGPTQRKERAPRQKKVREG